MLEDLLHDFHLFLADPVLVLLFISGVFYGHHSVPISIANVLRNRYKCLTVICTLVQN